MNEIAFVFTYIWLVTIVIPWVGFGAIFLVNI